MRAAIRDRLTGASIEIDLGQCSVTFEGRAVAIHNIRVAQFLFHLFRRAPNLFTLGEVNDEILKPHEIGQGKSQDPGGYIRKLKLQATQLLSSITGREDVILTVRSAGYRVGDGWSPVPSAPSSPPARVEDDLESLSDTARAAVELMRGLALVGEASGGLVLDRAPKEQEIRALSERYVSVVRRLLAWLRADASPLFERQMVAIFRAIHSYVAMARIGHGVDEGTWRLLFERELLAHVDLIVECCRHASMRAA